LVDDPEWRVEVYLAGMGRCHDFKNLDMIKHKVRTEQETKQLYKRVGILNLFSPYRPNGDYLLNMAIYEEKTVAKMLCELAKSEGWNFMTNLKVGGQTIEKANNEVLRQITDSGAFECSYQCPPEKEKLETREKLG
jgi:hypothetical protein